MSAIDFLDTLSCDEQRILDERLILITTIELNILVLNRERKLELKNVEISLCRDARFVTRASWTGRLGYSWVKIMVKFNRTVDQPTRKLVAHHLRAVRDLRGELLR